MSLIDNPDSVVPLNNRLETLREHKERWQKFDIKWKASASVPPRLGAFQSLKGEAGVLYVGARDELETRKLYSTSLPSNADQTIQWSTFRPANPDASILAYTLSIEENDLLACVTYHNIPSSENSFAIQVHFIQHSTQLPYPGLSSPILDVCFFERPADDEHDYPVANLAIRGSNMAIVVGHASLQQASYPDEFEWTGHLSFWNWRTGEKKGKRTNIPDKHQALQFLKEDTLLHGRSLDLCLDMYHIPAATSHGEICVIEQLGLPGIKKEFSDTLLYDIDISLPDNSTSVASFTESSEPKTTRPFITDPLSSILVIDLMVQDRYQMPRYFSFITHRRTLLDRADTALSRHSKPKDAGILIPDGKVAWDEWGPDATRMFWRNERYSTALLASNGTRYFALKNDEIEVYDFGHGGTEDVQRKRTIVGQNETEEPSDRRRFAAQGDDDPSCQGDCLQDGIRTKLPFGCEVFENKLDGIEIEEWEAVYVDQSRIVGLQDEQIDLLYIG